MDLKGNELITLLVILELVQLVGFWAFVRFRYRHSLRQMSRLTGQLAVGQRPTSYYIDGPPLVEQVSRHLESIGARLEQFQRQQQEEDFNLNVLLANMVEGVMVVDQRHMVRLTNDELLNLFSLKQSPLGRTVLESLREAGVEMIVRETILRGESRQQEVVLESTALGLPPRHFDINVVPIRAKNDEVRGAVVVFHDITRIKQLEVVRQEFVANVSHELRTPLAIFRGYLETLADNPDMPREESQRILETMRRHSDRLNALVEDLLVLTRLEARQIKAEFSTVRVDAFFRQLVRDWESGRIRRGGDRNRNTGRSAAVGRGCASPGAGHFQSPGKRRSLFQSAPARRPFRRAARRPNGGARGRQRHGHSAERPAPYFRALLPGRQGPQPHLRRHRAWAFHREAHRPVSRRHGPRRERIGEGHDDCAAPAAETRGFVILSLSKDQFNKRLFLLSQTKLPCHKSRGYS